MMSNGEIHALLEVHMIEADCAMFCFRVAKEWRRFAVSRRKTPRHQNEETQHRTRSETFRVIKVTI